MAPKRKHQMAVKDQNSEKDIKSHPTIQLAQHLAEGTSSHAISHPTASPARTSNCIPPPSIQGVNSPCTSRPTNPDAGCTLDIVSDQKTAARRKFVRKQMAQKDQNKGIASKSHPTKQRTTYLAQTTSQNPSCASQSINSMEGAHSPARTSDVSPPPSTEGVQSPARTSDVSPPPLMERVHSRRTSQPTNLDARCTVRSFSALETQTNDAKPILYLDGQGFLPSRQAANGIGDILKRNFTDPWPSWKKIPISTRNSWFEEFLEIFSVSPPDYNWAKKNFEMRGSVLMKNYLNKARTTMDKPNWIEDGVWERLCEHWRSEGFKKKSTQAKTNRANCGASHTGGSISASQHRVNMMKETGTTPTPLELFRRTHQHKDNTWVDRRSQDLTETFTHTFEQLTKRALAQGKPPPTELDVWCDVARSKKGKVYGLGMKPTVMASTPCYHCSSSSSIEWVKKQEFDELRKEMEEVRNERDKLQARVANTEKLVEHNNALIRELIESMNTPYTLNGNQDEDDEGEDESEYEDDEE